MREFKNVEIVQLCCKCNRALKKGKNYCVLSPIAEPLLFLIAFEMAMYTFNLMINHPFNLFLFLVLLSIPLIPGIIYIGTRLKRAYARKKYIKKYL